MPELPTFSNNCSTDGIMPSIAGILGSLQANEVVKTILNLNKSLSGKIIIFDGLKLSMRETKIMINKKCLNKC